MPFPLRNTFKRIYLFTVVSDWYHSRMAMTLRLTSAQDHALNLLAQAQGISKQEAAARAIVTAATRLIDETELTSLTRNETELFLSTRARIRQARS